LVDSVVYMAVAGWNWRHKPHDYYTLFLYFENVLEKGVLLNKIIPKGYFYYEIAI
jgi:hypothetical protein